MSDQENIQMLLKIRELFGGLTVAEIQRRLSLVESGGLNDSYLRGWQDCFDTVNQQTKET